MFTNCCVYWMPLKLFLFILKNVLRILKLRNITFVDTLFLKPPPFTMSFAGGEHLLAVVFDISYEVPNGKPIQLSDIAMLPNWVRILYIVN